MASRTQLSDRSPGWPVWALGLFVLGAVGLCVAGVIAVIQARQPGSLILGLIAAVVGAGFLLTTPGWFRVER